MAKITIKAEKRTANEKLNLLRIDGLFPAVAYGK
jgi:ribosomal protein L25 (general stress protein Ctc)